MGEAGGALCLAAAQLVGRHLRFDSADPRWADRDRVVADPACAAVAAALCGLSGTPELCAVHGPAVGCGVGLALAERLLAARFGRSLVDHRSWVFCAGASLATGPVQEAAWLAGAWRLGRLTVIADAGDEQPVAVSGFAASSWVVWRVGAADAQAVAAALSASLRSVRPTLIVCVGLADAGGGIDARDGDAGAAWKAAGRRLAGVRRGWLKRLHRHGSRVDFDQAVSGRLQGGWHTAVSEPGPLLPIGQTTGSTAAALMRALCALPAGLAELAVLPGLAAWPAPPAQTEPPAASRAEAGRLPSGVGGALCGVALHGGLVPVAALPAGESDAVLPALREAASARTRLVLILLEAEGTVAGQRTALHAIPNLQVFRPADASEALECLELAIRHACGPSVLLASGAPRPLLAERPARTRSARGGYVVAEAPGLRNVTLIASGGELDVALQARVLLIRRGIRTAVVSLPCWDLFAAQDASWRDGVLGSAPRVVIDPGGAFGWARWLGRDGMFVAVAESGARLSEAVLRNLAPR